MKNEVYNLSVHNMSISIPDGYKTYYRIWNHETDRDTVKCWSHFKIEKDYLDIKQFNKQKCKWLSFGDNKILLKTVMNHKVEEKHPHTTEKNCNVHKSTISNYKNWKLLLNIEKLSSNHSFPKMK